MNDTKQLSDNLKVVYNLLSQCTLPPVQVGKMDDVLKVVASLRTVISMLDEGGLTASRTPELAESSLDFVDDYEDEEVTDASE